MLKRFLLLFTMNLVTTAILLGLYLLAASWMQQNDLRPWQCLMLSSIILNGFFLIAFFGNPRARLFFMVFCASLIVSGILLDSIIFLFPNIPFTVPIIMASGWVSGLVAIPLAHWAFREKKVAA